jgi:hypothetical protein
MKLRNLKRRHVARLRQRIVHARFNARIDRLIDECLGNAAAKVFERHAQVQALFYRVIAESLQEVIKPIARVIEKSGGQLSGGSVTSDVVDLRDTDLPMTIGLIPKGMRIEGSNASGPLAVYVDGSQLSAASLVAAGGDLLDALEMLTEERQVDMAVERREERS